MFVFLLCTLGELDTFKLTCSGFIEVQSSLR